MEDNDKEDNNYKDISALGLDRDLGFSRGHQGHRPPDDDDDEEEDDDVVEDNNKDHSNFKDIKISISALRLDRNLGFLLGHQGHRPNDDDDLTGPARTDPNAHPPAGMTTTTTPHRPERPAPHHPSTRLCSPHPAPT